METGHSPRTISTYIAALNFYHKANGWKNIADNFTIKKMLEGCRRLKQTKDNRAPLTRDILQSINRNLQFICSDRFEETLFQAAYALTYFGLFRVSEVVANSESKKNNSIKLQDTVISKKNVTVTLHHTKNNQIGTPVKVKIPHEEDNIICPVYRLNQYLAIRPNYAGPLFCHINGSALTRYQFASVLNKTLNRLNIIDEKYRTHSFRIGRATELAKLGIPHENIKKLGRWSSKAYQTYIR